MNKKQIRLYNVIFPVWLLWLIPVTWIVVLPANFVVDLLVVLLTMKALKITELRRRARAVIVRVWLLGFAADFAGTALMFLSNIIDLDYGTPLGRWWYENITNAVAYSPFDSVFSVLWITVCVALTGVLIYWLNLKVSLKKLDLPDAQKKKVALSLAVFTAPYLFYLPTSWFF